MLILDKVNAIARKIYLRLGYRVAEGYDFENATHPQEKLCWELACLVWEEITGDTPDLGADWWRDE
ncbi:MAG: hypothetical protein F6J93_03620 [Oscillatoria sp. SIO1A7]|nr:hypothetical protein [Oscillatoria sp. SIO1A7]